MLGQVMGTEEDILKDVAAFRSEEVVPEKEEKAEDFTVALAKKATNRMSLISLTTLISTTREKEAVYRLVSDNE